MDSKRDPRKDPRPGDVTTLDVHGERFVWRVTGREDRLVAYDVTFGGVTEPCDTFIEDWIDGSDTDEVLHVAD